MWHLKYLQEIQTDLEGFGQLDGANPGLEETKSFCSK